MGQRFKSVSRQMIFPNEKYSLSNPKFLLYFLPRKLKEESIFPMTALSFKKKNLEFEVQGFNIVGVQQSIGFLSCLENRFCLYENNPLFVNQEFSLCFQSLDLSTETLTFTRRKRKPTGKVGILPFLLEKDIFFKKLQTNSLVKTRLLKLTKGGFVSSCFGNPAFILRSSLFYKFCKQRSYRSWFSLNLQYYGFLSYFFLIHFKRITSPYSKRHSQRFLSKRFRFYYLKNEVVKYFFLLAKPKVLKLIA